MRGEVKRDLEQSARLMREVVWPAIRPVWFGDRATYQETETSADSIHQRIDRAAGIDAWVDDGEGAMYSVSTRVQKLKPGQRSWRTFTIRSRRAKRMDGTRPDTEQHKRLAATEKGAARSDVTWQAYVSSENRLEYACNVRTADLWTWITSNRQVYERQQRRNPDDGVLFNFVYVAQLERAGHEVKVYPPAFAPHTTLNVVYVRCVDCGQYGHGFCEAFGLKPELPAMKIRICGRFVSANDDDYERHSPP